MVHCTKMYTWYKTCISLIFINSTSNLLTHSCHDAGYYLKIWLSLSLSKNSLSLWNPKVHYVFTKACHWTLSRASQIQSTPSIPISLRSILMLSSHLCLVFPVVSYLWASQPKSCKHPSPPPCMPHVLPTSSSI
jgi:hypothetical protein